MPLGPAGKPLTEMDRSHIHLLIADIKKNQKVTDHNWILAGTSMGGLAAFNFALSKPELFEGIITFPGGLGKNEISDKWGNYTVLLAGGELDEADWKTLNSDTQSKLEGNVKSVTLFTIKGQGHIISPEYDIDKVYKKYFKLTQKIN
jgi:S-formylglutathione hydrolase FrmB